MIKHSSMTSEWHTPLEILDRARAVLGGIDVDPASDASANARVGARRFITAAEDGLALTWCQEPSTVWINPPGGGLALPFWSRLMAHRQVGLIKHAIFLAFNAELLQTSQGREWPSIGDFLICAPAKRIRFLRPDGSQGPSPTHSSLIVYVDGAEDCKMEFVRAFRDLGVMLGAV